MPAHENRLIFKMAVILTKTKSHDCVPIPTFEHMGKNIVLVYTCTALIIREINTRTVSTLRGIKSKHSHLINLFL